MTREDGTPLGKGTCDVCRRSRELFRIDTYHRRCRECLPLRDEELSAAVKAGRERVQVRTAKARFAYPCIGGPLDGEHAMTTDFYREGIYEHLRYDYHEFNSGSGRSRKVIGAPASMLFIHKDLVGVMIKGRDR